MTPDEAIKKFEKIKKGNIYLIHQRIEGKEVFDDYSLCDMAISALEKQIPKKAMKSIDAYNKNLYKLYCPTCGAMVANGNSRVGFMNKVSNGYERCAACGQMIDWEGEE